MRMQRRNMNQGEGLKEVEGKGMMMMRGDLHVIVS